MTSLSRTVASLSTVIAIGADSQPMEEFKKRRKLDHKEETIGGRQVKIKLTESAKEYEVNVGLLRIHSAFFNKAFDKETGMKESIEGYIELPDVSSDILEIYIYWIYNRIIVLPDGSDSEDLCSDNLLTFVDLYVFADLYDTRELRNDIVNIFFDYLEDTTFNKDLVGAALHKLPPTSKLYGVLLSDAQYDLDLQNKDRCEEVSKHFPPEAVATLIHAYANDALEDTNQLKREEWLEQVEQ